MVKILIGTVRDISKPLSCTWVKQPDHRFTRERVWNLIYNAEIALGAETSLEAAERGVLHPRGRSTRSERMANAGQTPLISAVCNGNRVASYLRRVAQAACASKSRRVSP